MSRIGPLRALPATFAICRLDAGAKIPAWATTGELSSITRSADELSIVCEQQLVPTDVTAERDWRALKVPGPLDFSLTGIMARLTQPLAAAEISVFAISTFDTDYLLIKANQFDAARALLAQI